ncbi:hypothetical protein RJ640_017481 [Escallonia rubra]|uniref:NB-ARC domain-containing protein n=1 Tax=Escallonia rubra TaxID=112253 RepID=A0AA88RA99_9ASTE|nr:hypothetical protein RJ640_017481 [Escallonia rubra]
MATAMGQRLAHDDGSEGQWALRGLTLVSSLLFECKYLIILDDVNNFHETLGSGLSYDDEKGEEIESGLPKGCGGTVIVTSRDEEVGKQMVGEEKSHKLVPLSDKEIWLTFKDSIQKDGTERPSGLQTLKEDIVNKCGGLPLAAKMMGGVDGAKGVGQMRVEGRQAEERVEGLTEGEAAGSAGHGVLLVGLGEKGWKT